MTIQQLKLDSVTFDSTKESPPANSKELSSNSRRNWAAKVSSIRFYLHSLSRFLLRPGSEVKGRRQGDKRPVPPHTETICSPTVSSRLTSHECFWTVGGRWRTWRGTKHLLNRGVQYSASLPATICTVKSKVWT